MCALTWSTYHFVLHQRSVFHVYVLFVIKAVLFITAESNVWNYKKKKKATCLHAQSFNFRIKQIEDQANKYAQNRTVDEVIKRLKDREIQQAATIKDSFFAYNKQSHRKINKAGLWKVGKMLAIFLSPVLFPERYLVLAMCLLTQLELNPPGPFQLLMS